MKAQGPRNTSSAKQVLQTLQKLVPRAGPQLQKASKLQLINAVIAYIKDAKQEVLEPVSAAWPKDYSNDLCLTDSEEDELDSGFEDECEEYFEEDFEDELDDSFWNDEDPTDIQKDTRRISMKDLSCVENMVEHINLSSGLSES